MGIASGRPVGISDIVAAIIVAIVFILLASLLREPTRQRFNAILVAGAGAAYLGAGLGWLEIPFTVVMTYVAYRGLELYRFICVAWLLHATWDTVHHLYGQSIIPMIPNSSAQCAVCDAIIAMWFFAGAPSVFRNKSPAPS